MKDFGGIEYTVGLICFIMFMFGAIAPFRMVQLVFIVGSVYSFLYASYCFYDVVRFYRSEKLKKKKKLLKG